MSNLKFWLMDGENMLFSPHVPYILVFATQLKQKNKPKQNNIYMYMYIIYIYHKDIAKIV